MVKKSMRHAMERDLATERVDAKDFAGVGLTELLRLLRLALLLLTVISLTSCRASSSGQSEPLSTGALAREYQESTTDVRRKYDGKEITVKGLAMITPMMPPADSDQGLVFLDEKEANPPRRVSCWFSNDQAEHFSKIKGGQLITVKGIFNGEAGAELKFCKLVKFD
jgi:hypothetical protein